MFTKSVFKRCTGRSRHTNGPYRKDMGKTRCGPTFLARATAGRAPRVANHQRCATPRSASGSSDHG